MYEEELELVRHLKDIACAQAEIEKLTAPGIVLDGVMMSTLRKSPEWKAAEFIENVLHKQCGYCGRCVYEEGD